MRLFVFLSCALVVAACGGSSPAAPNPPAGAPGPSASAPSLQSIALAQTAVAGGESVQGTVTLTAPAPASGVTVSLASSHAAVRMSASVVVPSGATTATFAITTETVSSDAEATVTATLDGVARTASLRVTAPPGTGTAPISLTSQHNDVIGGDATTGILSASSPAPAGGIRIDLSSSDADVSVPASVVIAPGATSATFEIRTSAVMAEKDVRITATVAASLRSASVQVVLVIKLLPPRPRVDSVSPAHAMPGASANITVSGSMFLPGSTVSVSGSGVSVSGLVVESLTVIRATLTVASSAASGNRQITVTTASGSASAVFTVGTAAPPPPPTITLVLPNPLRQGTFGGMAIIGTNFSPGLSVSISGTGVALENVEFINQTNLGLGVHVSGAAPLGMRTLTVTTSAGTSQGFPIEVVPPTPRVSGISPSKVLAGTSVDITIFGENFFAPVTVEPFFCEGVTASNVSLVSATQINARLTMTLDAQVLTCFIHVRSTGATAVGTVEVVPQPPVITGLSPNPYTGPRAEFQLFISGSNLRGFPVVTVSGTGVSIFNVSVHDKTSLVVRLRLESTFTYGDRDIVVTTTGGTSNTFKWTTVAPALAPLIIRQ